MTVIDKKAFRIGIDIGGTFTDIIFVTADGRIFRKKVNSSPLDYSAAVISGLKELMDDSALHAKDATDIVHATTVATNTILEGKGAHTGLITTEGFRDVLEFRRVRFPELYNLQYKKPKPLVERRDRLEVKERISANGCVRVPLDEKTVYEAAERLKKRKVQSVAICLLHSYLNPTHELRVKEIIKDILPIESFICASYDVLPEIREYERTSTTVVNAYLGPIMKSYLSRIASKLAAIEINAPIFVMQSGGGQMALLTALDQPAYLLESGPAAGVVAANEIAKQSGLDKIITLDIGGTTAKTAIVEKGEPIRTSEYEVGAGINLSSKLTRGAGYAIKLPFIDVSEIGAGGGSVVWFDEGGLIKVGPKSAGADPGPIAYGLGGSEITLTDANICLGYLSPNSLLGGTMQINGDLSNSALEAKVCKRLNINLADAALGISKIAISNMVRAVKSVSTYRGRDPRDFTLVVFGGNGALLAGTIADELNIRKIIVPYNSGVLSALGLLLADTTHEIVKSFPGLLKAFDPKKIEEAFKELLSQARRKLLDQGFPEEKVIEKMLIDLRYKGQAFELPVRIKRNNLKNVESISKLFNAEHLKTYGHYSPDEEIEVVNLRVSASVPSVINHVEKLTTDKMSEKRYRSVFFSEAICNADTPIIKNRGNVENETIRGPAVIEEYDSTILIPPGWKAKLDQLNNVVLTK